MNLANCATFNLPATNFNDCNPEINYSEIERIFIGGPQAAAFTNILLATEWTDRLSQNTIGPDAIRALTVIADKPAATSVIKELSNGRRKPIGKDHTVAYTIDDISDLNYTLLTVLEANPIIRLFGLETQGGKLYHFGPEGILVNNDANVILSRGRDEIERIDGTLSWRSAPGAMLRGTSPIFQGNGGGGVTSFDTELSFDADATPDASGVAATASGTDAEQAFEFNAIGSPAGTPASMTILVGGVEEVVIDFPNDYVGQPFRYTDKAGATHSGTFVDGDVNF